MSITILSIFYLVGCLVSFLLSIWLYIETDPKEKKYAELEMVAPMVLMSWATVVLYIYSKIETNKHNEDN